MIVYILKRSICNVQSDAFFYTEEEAKEAAKKEYLEIVEAHRKTGEFLTGKFDKDGESWLKRGTYHWKWRIVKHIIDTSCWIPATLPPLREGPYQVKEFAVTRRSVKNGKKRKPCTTHSVYDFASKKWMERDAEILAWMPLPETYEVKGYMVFPSKTKKDTYEVGNVYEIDENPIIGHRGYHYCRKVSDCLQNFQVDPSYKIVEINDLGYTDSKNGIFCTNKIRIVREIPWNVFKNMADLENSL